MKKSFTGIVFCLIVVTAFSQDFYYGADLSYVNEMEDCGVVYKENNLPKEPYQIFADHNCNLVRLRLWHSPSWYDNLNAGDRYSDLADVMTSIQRAKSAAMPVLLDFHLSDNWADPSKQVVPAAWSDVVDNLDVLKDSLYNYIYQTLSELHLNDLMPKMVQIGNETNRGILLSQAVNDAGWTLDWSRNSQLFNSAIQAVRDIENATGKTIQIAIHIADPAEVDWYISNFIANGVTDFDIIGISYYHQWHNSTSISQVGSIVSDLKQNYNKEVMIFETGYPWTGGGNDNANNILNSSHPNYDPLSPSNQKQWLLDLTQSVKNNGGKGVIYWEPAWVSSSCSTQWAQGSHFENAAFFDFQNNLIPDGGIKWMEDAVVSTHNLIKQVDFVLVLQENHQVLKIRVGNDFQKDSLKVSLYALDGSLVLSETLKEMQTSFSLFLPIMPHGIYLVSIQNDKQNIWSYKVAIFQ